MIIDSSILLFFQLAVLSAFLGPDQIATETLLAADPEVFPWVQKYQRSRETVSETDYEVSANLEICLHGFVNILDLTVGLKFSFRLIWSLLSQNWVVWDNKSIMRRILIQSKK